MKTTNNSRVSSTEGAIVPTPLVRGDYILKWVFLFSQFWPIDIFIVEKCEWYD